MEEFNLSDDDFYAIEIAKNVARNFLRIPDITPRQVIGLGNALYSLERMPNVTPGAFVEFGISYKAGTDDFHEKRFIIFHISENMFQITIGGSVYDKKVGSDSFSEPGWTIEIGGFTERECDLSYLENQIQEFLNLGASIRVDDQSEIDY